MTSLSIILVNYKAPQLVLDCLATVIIGSTNTDEMEIIVVDNGSADDSENIILSKYPAVIWIQMGYNSGFARANNAGIRIAKGNAILLLNSDTLNENNALFQCYERLISSSHAFAGVQLLNTDRSPQISGNFFMKGGLNHLMAVPYSGRILRWIALNTGVKKTNVPLASNEEQVDWINGAFLMVKKSAIDAAGLLDEDFFLYAEEIEWCSRLRKHCTACIYGDLHVVHLQGATANKAFNSESSGYHALADKKGYQLMLSGLVRIRKQFGVGWFLFHLLFHLATIPFYFIIVLLQTLTGKLKQWKTFAGFSGNVFGVCGHLIAILRNKPHFYKVL